MKKIIDGKTYNTETAKAVFVWCNGEYGNMSYVEETLYKKKTGEYFLYGISGANGKYAESIGCNSWSGGAAFIPYTEDQAKKVVGRTWKCRRVHKRIWRTGGINIKIINLNHE